MTFDPYQRRVKDEMSRDVVSIESTAPLLDALERMETENVTVLPVVDQDHRCLGVISATDIIRTARNTVSRLRELAELGQESRRSRLEALIDNGMGQQFVQDVMQYQLKSVNQEMTIAEAGSKMLYRRIHHLPVVDQEQRLVGIIATLDLLAAFVKGAAKQSSQS